MTAFRQMNFTRFDTDYISKELSNFDQLLKKMLFLQNFLPENRKKSWTLNCKASKKLQTTKIKKVMQHFFYDIKNYFE